MPDSHIPDSKIWLLLKVCCTFILAPVNSQGLVCAVNWYVITRDVVNLSRFRLKWFEKRRQLFKMNVDRFGKVWRVYACTVFTCLYATVILIIAISTVWHEIIKKFNKLSRGLRICQTSGVNDWVKKIQIPLPLPGRENALLAYMPIVHSGWASCHLLLFILNTHTCKRASLRKCQTLANTARAVNDRTFCQATRTQNLDVKFWGSRKFCGTPSRNVSNFLIFQHKCCGVQHLVWCKNLYYCASSALQRDISSYFDRHCVLFLLLQGDVNTCHRR